MPTNPEISAFLGARGRGITTGSVPKTVGRLVKSGRIVVHVYPRNWRVVIICTGQHAGKVTMPSPGGGDPLVVIDEAERVKRDAQVGLRTRKRRLIGWNGSFG